MKSQVAKKDGDGEEFSSGTNLRVVDERRCTETTRVVDAAESVRDFLRKLLGAVLEILLELL